MSDISEEEIISTESILRNHLSLPNYLIDAFSDLFKEDGLLVLGRGLGLLPLLASFVRFVSDKSYIEISDESSSDDINHENKNLALSPTKSNIHKPPLIFVLGLDEIERNSLMTTLESWGTPSELLPTIVTNESGQGKDRALMYNRGGVFLITSRILIVDLLTHVANPMHIEGILVAHAENVTEQSTEAFIIRIYRTQRHWALENSTNFPSISSVDNKFVPPKTCSKMGFVKAFTDDPVKLLDGFAKVDKVLKFLYVRKLYLYPRFHNSIVDEFEGVEPIVEELRVKLSPLMKDVQNAIAAAVQACIRQLKNATTLIEWNESELTLDNFVTKNFDMVISRQLEHDWHRLKPATKQLVSDLRTLRALFLYLVQYDCVSFYKLIQNIKSMSAASRYPSMWLLTEAAQLLFRKAKERVYRIFFPISNKEKNDESKSKSGAIGKIKPVLEENPKWKVLGEILTEIKDEYDKKKAYDSSYDCGPCLIMVKDNRTLESIRSYLSEGKDRTMTLRWLRYLEHFNDRSRVVTKVAGDTKGISEECRLLLEEEGRARLFLFGTTTKRGKKRWAYTNSVPSWLRKRRKVEEERHRGTVLNSSEDIKQQSIIDEAVECTQKELDENDDEDGSNAVVREKVSIIESEVKVSDNANEYSSSDLEDEITFHVSRLPNLRVTLRSYGSIEGEQALLMLQDLRPSNIILYDAEASFVRTIELYSSSCNRGNVNNERLSEDVNEINNKLKVFFMLFEASVEEKTYLKSLQREKTAFERLIQHKKTMPVILNTMDRSFTQEMQQSSGAVSSHAGGTLPLSVDTRTGRGKQNIKNKERRDIACDVREFRSSLPSILHQGGMRIAPVTLYVGDFVLSPVHCVERKSVGDLFGSFASGRLFTQAESMSKYYKCPCLLIEFDPQKAFSLQNSAELGSEIRAESVCSKMSLLVMHFPKLRILWSRGPFETLKIFKALKANHDEVNVEKAIEIGSNESIDALFEPSNSTKAGKSLELQSEVNDAAKNMLLRLPGININNARKVMSSCSCIADLAKMPRENLKELLGPISGQKLFTFFRQTID